MLEDKAKLIYHLNSSMNTINSKIELAIMNPVKFTININTIKETGTSKTRSKDLPLGRISLKRILSFFIDVKIIPIERITKIPLNHNGKNPGPGPNSE